MTGVGFDLPRAVQTRPGVMTEVRANASASLISSGGWILTLLTLLTLSTLLVESLCSRSVLDETQARLFRSLVTYAFAFSLLAVGTVQLAFTRYVSDVLSSGRHQEILLTFTTALRVCCFFQAITALAFCYVAGFSPQLTFVVVALYIVVSATWLAVAWLTLIRQYHQVLIAYLLGMLVSILAMQLCVADLERALGACALGQGLTLGLLIRLIIRGTSTGETRDSQILHSLRTYPDLVGAGLFCSGAIWVDKLLFWFRDGIAVQPMLCCHPLYDICALLAYLTVIPAMAINLVHFATTFNEHQRSYHGAILGNMPMREIEWRRGELVSCLRDGAVRLLRLQGWITAVAIVFAAPLLRWLDMPEGAVPLFRVLALGAFFHILFLIAVLVQLSFDLRREALLCLVVFFIANGSLTWLSMDLGVAYYGTGYTLAAIFSLLLASTILARSLERLEYLTFSRLAAGAQAGERWAQAAERRAQAAEPSTQPGDRVGD